MSVLDRPVFFPSGEAARSLRRILSLVLTLALVGLAILLPVMQSSDETAQGYRIRALEQQRSDLEAQIYNAQADIAQLGSLARIDSEARGRLGMVPASGTVAVSINVPKPAPEAVPSRYLAPIATPSPTPSSRPLWRRLLQRVPWP